MWTWDFLLTTIVWNTSQAFSKNQIDINHKLMLLNRVWILGYTSDCKMLENNLLCIVTCFLPSLYNVLLFVGGNGPE